MQPMTEKDMIVMREYAEMSLQTYTKELKRQNCIWNYIPARSISKSLEVLTCSNVFCVFEI